MFGWALNGEFGVQDGRLPKTVWKGACGCCEVPARDGQIYPGVRSRQGRHVLPWGVGRQDMPYPPMKLMVRSGWTKSLRPILCPGSLPKTTVRSLSMMS